jgi:hypothetical protein
VSVQWSWRLLWSGRLKVRLRPPPTGSGLIIEWGPPILWRPRFTSWDERAELVNTGWSAGWLWWMVSYARLRRPEQYDYDDLPRVVAEAVAASDGKVGGNG